MTVEPSAQPANDDPGQDKEAILADIDRTREQLGETVEALAAKADVKAQAQQKVADVKAQAQQKAADARALAVQKTADVTGTIKASVAGPASKVRETGASVWESAPEPVQRQTRTVAARISQYRRPIAGVAASLLAGWLIVRRVRHR